MAAIIISIASSIISGMVLFFLAALFQKESEEGRGT